MSEPQADRQPGLLSRLLHRGSQTALETPPSTAVEPCFGCGEETAIGSVFFSDRRAIARSDGSSAYLCSECQVKAHHARKGAPLSEADLRTIADTAKATGSAYFGGPGAGAF